MKRLAQVMCLFFAAVLMCGCSNSGKNSNGNNSNGNNSNGNNSNGNNSNSNRCRPYRPYRPSKKRVDAAHTMQPVARCAGLASESLLS